MNQDFSTFCRFQAISVTSCKCDCHFCIRRSIHNTFTRFHRNSLSHSTAREYWIIDIFQVNHLTNDWRNDCFIRKDWRSCFISFYYFFCFSHFFFSIFVTKCVSQTKSKTSSYKYHKDILKNLTIQIEKRTWDNSNTKSSTSKSKNRS